MFEQDPQNSFVLPMAHLESELGDNIFAWTEEGFLKQLTSGEDVSSLLEELVQTRTDKEAVDGWQVDPHRALDIFAQASAAIAMRPDLQKCTATVVRNNKEEVVFSPLGGLEWGEMASAIPSTMKTRPFAH